GLLIAPKERVPAGAVLLEEFWKSKAAARAPAAGGVEGTVESVDASTGMVTISVGSDAGVAKGMRLDVFRLAPTARYLGKLDVVEVRARQSVARPVGRPHQALQRGD